MARSIAAAAAAALAITAGAYKYDVTMVSKGAVPAMSIKKAPGSGYGPCECIFNPAYMAPRPGQLNATALIVRASGCTPEFGGNGDHLLSAYCNDDGTCGDLLPYPFTFEASAEDPRIFYYDGYYWMYYFAAGSGQSTVYLRKSLTPMNGSSWESVLPAPLPWHRNGCVIIRDDGNHYVIYGETGALPGIGIASTRDFVNYTVINSTWLEPLGSNNTAEPEIVLEASAAPVQLSTGDYLFLYAAGTPGWVANGNYTGGWLILDRHDPTHILQRSSTHLFVPTMDYEIGDGIWPVQRNRTIFATSVVPLAGAVDAFRVWYGAADANVATAIIKVTATTE